MANITLPTPGGDADVWGPVLNTALSLVNVESSQNAATLATYANSKQNKLVAGTNITIDASNPAAPVISSAGSVDAEQVRDIIGAALAGSGLITVTVNDAADTITISTAATTNSPDAQLRDRSTHTGTQPQSSIVDLSTDLAAKAPLASPTFTGDPKAPTPATSDSDTSIATTAFVRAAIDSYSPVGSGSGSTFVYHGTNASYARPGVSNPIVWVGTVAPANRLAQDFYLIVDAAGGGTTPPTFTGAFDSYAVPHRALSLRRVLTAYTGPLIRVRRAADNLEADIGYTSAGDLDTIALLNHVGSDSGYLTTWYDQSGNGRNMTQTTTTAQPRIVNAGVVDTLSSSLTTPRPAFVLDGTDDYLLSTATGLYAAGAASMGIVFAAASASNATVVSETKSTNAGALYRLLRSSTANANVQGTNEAGTSMWASSATGSNVFDNTIHEFFYADNGSTISTWKDATQAHNAIAATRSGTFTPDRFAIGAHVGTAINNFTNGRIQEVILWASDRTTDRAGIQSAQKTYWGSP